MIPDMIDDLAFYKMLGILNTKMLGILNTKQ